MFETLRGGVIDDCDGILGDTIRYRPRGTAHYRDVLGYVECRDAIVDISSGALIDQNHMVRVARKNLTAKPVREDRLILPQFPGTAFCPINAVDDGDDWLFEVKRV